MTEAEWLACTKPEPMRQYVCDKISERKRLLCVVAWFRCTESVAWGRSSAERYRAQVQPEGPYRSVEVAERAERFRAIQIAERFAEGLVCDAERDRGGCDWYLQRVIPILMGGRHKADHPKYIQLLRDIIGNPFRPVTLDAAWRTPQVAALAQAAYDQRELPAGTLDGARLAVLADALEEAGCDQADLLGHLRGPGPHVRGCWAGEGRGG